MFKQVDGPPVVPASGMLFGYNEFRGSKKQIRLDVSDRRRHTYIIGQTGSGKSVLLENLALQDMLAGNGFAFIDPHGDVAEKLLSMVPKNRAEDVIYFNPADTQHPLGLNLFEFQSPEQKDFLIQESINMLYKIYDPDHTGMIGPRFEQWFRNTALTLMSDPAGSTFIEIPKVFIYTLPQLVTYHCKGVIEMDQKSQIRVLVAAAVMVSGSLIMERAVKDLSSSQTLIRESPTESEGEKKKTKPVLYAPSDEITSASK